MRRFDFPSTWIIAPRVSGLYEVQVTLKLRVECRADEDMDEEAERAVREQLEWARVNNDCGDPWTVESFQIDRIERKDSQEDGEE